MTGKFYAERCSRFHTCGCAKGYVNDIVYFRKPPKKQRLSGNLQPWNEKREVRSYTDMYAKYQNIYDYYLDAINRGEYAPGAALPSEGKMMEEFSVSRDTVRRAMNQLEQEGYILKSRGRESLVADTHRHAFPISKIRTFTELMKEEGVSYTTKVEDLSILLENENALSLLEAEPGEEIYQLIRSRRIEGERIILDKDLLRRRYVPLLTKKVCQGSLYAYLEQELGLKIGIAKKIVSVQPVTPEDQYYLDLHGDTVVASVISYTRLETGELFQYCESRHRIDRFRFIEYAKR